MKVAEKDWVILDVLEDERQRIIHRIEAIRKEISELPSYSIRKKVYKDKTYYYAVKSIRQGKKVISRHIKPLKKEELELIEKRKKLKAELKRLKLRLELLNKFLKHES